jgi:hypothetical protein
MVKARIQSSTLPDDPFSLLPGAKIRCGFYRTEFSHDRCGRNVEQKERLHNLSRTVEGPPPIEEWIS